MPDEAPTPEPRARRARITILGLRRLIVLVLAVAVLAFTGGVFALVRQIFNNFGPAVKSDLDWKTVRGAQELARAADLGLVVGDGKLVTEAFGDYRRLEDVMTIVAVDAGGVALAVHGRPPEPVPALFSGPPAKVRAEPGHLVAWAPVIVEGKPVGKVAIALSTRRLEQSQRLLREISEGTAGAGAIALLCGMLFINFFTRSIVQRDQQLAAYASSLEAKVAERTAELDRMNQGMRLVLDNVGQGFVTVGMDGTLASERSAIVDRWFGAPAPGTTFSAYLRPADTRAADWFQIGLDALVEDVLPRDLLLSQLPKRMSCGALTFDLAYTPITCGPAAALERLLVVITDITDELAREKMERDNQEMTRIFKRATDDRVGAAQFFAEADELVRAIAAGAQTREVDQRLVHTLKGVCALFGIESMAGLCHEVETNMQAGGDRISAQDRQHIRAQWAHVADLARGLLGERRSTIEIEEADLSGLVRAARAGAAGEEIAALAESWRHEPVALRLARLAEKAAYLAQRLDKPALTVHTDAAGLRLDAHRWAPFWSALVHGINNAVDHGIEDAAARLAAGKPAGGTLWLDARREGAALVVSLRDDGRGVDWPRIEERARERGLPYGSRRDLVDALFADGVSARGEVTAVSGRGVGLAALRAATVELGGSIEVQSEPSRGTTFSFRFPGC
jgi:two-component system chemotaxis sensor kinase CheA